MGLRLRVEHGSDSGKTVRLGSAGRYRFGRTPQCSFQILDMKVSKDHFEIWIGNGAAPAAGIRDLESSHGTWVNAQRVTGPLRPLSPGDEIRIGMTVLRVLSDGPADAEAPAVAPAPTEKEWAAASKANGGGAAGTTSTSQAPGEVKAPAAPPRKPQPPDPLVGRTLAGYRILERVGAGGMGAVYKAEQLSLHREVALKVLAERLVSDSAFVDQFVNEARAAGALNHPNVVQVYDVGAADGRHYFSMEFIHGGSLEDRVAAGGAPWEDALGWFQDAANALIFAEKKGILHRDIKPDNLMVSQDGTVKLCDLGLAKKSESADLLAQGIIGTPHFIAPEAIRRRLEVDRRADLYSLGCSFYRILAGKNPFTGASVKEILLAHLNQPPPRVSASAPSVPKELDEVVFRLMQKEPEKRYQEAEELWEALEKIRLQHGLAEHGLHPGRAKKIALVVVAVGVLAIGAAAYLILTNKEKVRTEFVDRPGEPVQPVATGVSPEVQRANEAETALLKLQTETLTAAGRLEDGENWRKGEWAGYPAALRALAERYAGTEAASSATEEANRVDRILTDKRKDAAAADAERKKALADLKTAVDKATEAVPPHVAAGRDHDAEAVVAAADAEVDEIAKRKRGAGAVVAAEEIGKAREALKALAEGVRKAAEDAWDQATNDAEVAVKTGDVDGLRRAISRYDAYLARPEPPGDAAGPVAKSVRAHRERAGTRKTEIQKRLNDMQEAQFLADKRVYLDLASALFDGTAGDGFYSGFRFSQASTKASDAFEKTKTPDYKALVQVHLRATRQLMEVVGKLADAFPNKGWEDRVRSDKVETDPWPNPAKVEDVTAQGVTIDKRFRHYKSLGIPWFLSTAIAGAKGGTRVPLDADEREALAVLAIAAIVKGAPEMLEVALAQSKAAAELDPARAERLAREVDAVAKREHAAVAEHQAIVALLQAVEKDMDEADPDRTSLEVFFEKGGKAKLLEKQAEWGARIEEAKRRFAALVEIHQDTIFVAVTSERPSLRAVFAGERRPSAAAAAAEEKKGAPTATDRSKEPEGPSEPADGAPPPPPDVAPPPRDPGKPEPR